ncbi:MAG: Na+/H+ antiporter NhaA [Clostridium sp.]
MDFVHSERKSISKLRRILEMEALPGLLLLVATVLALIVANGPFANAYHHVFEGTKIFGLTIHEIVNDLLMAIFFLVVGCEIKKEAISGHLSDLKKASFPIVAAFGGVIIPAIIFFLMNRGTSFSNGIGVPISTDIAFAIGAFMIFRKRLNSSLKIFLLTLAVVDDLLSIIIIGVFYSSSINLFALGMAGVVLILLFSLRKINKENKLYPYFILGAFLWFFVFKSGVHATISGVLLALALPLRVCDEKECRCVLSAVEHTLAPYANLIILPLFAFSNTAINLRIEGLNTETFILAVGIIVGLVIGKPLGIMLFTMIGTKLNLLEKPEGVKWYNVYCVSMLAGIGFTMSIFVSEIAFAGYDNALNIAKVSILIAAIISCTMAYLFINVFPIFKEKLVRNK